MVRTGLRKCYYDKAEVTEERVATCYRVLKTRAGLRAAMATEAQKSVNLTESVIGALEMPTLVIWGAQDQIIPLDSGRRLNALIRESRQVVL